MGAEVGCVLASLALGTGMVAGADRTLVTPTRGVGMGVAGCWFMATLTLEAGIGTGNGWAAALPTRGAGTDADGPQLPWKQGHREAEEKARKKQSQQK